MRRLAFSTLPQFNKPPRTWEAPSIFKKDGLQALFYEGLPYRGRETRVFAWIGLPKDADEKHPVPGIVLVHGGGGTAFPEWIRLWNDLGFAAIAMDNCGGVPAWNESPHHNPEWPRHEWSGPGGWGSKDIEENRLEDQWPFHATAAVLNAFELLRSLPQVDEDRIGVTGISWGGFLTCLAASLEERFRFAMPVYGCGGFDTPASSLMRAFTQEQREAWFGAWNPDLYLPYAKMPFLWLTDAEDAPYPLDCWNRSASLAANAATRRSIRIEYPHDHTISWQSKTIPAFAKGCLEGRSLPNLEQPVAEGCRISCRWTNGAEAPTNVQLVYTRASGVWNDLRWRTSPAAIADGTISAELPSCVRAAFFQLRDAAGCLWTSPLIQLQ